MSSSIGSDRGARRLLGPLAVLSAASLLVGYRFWRIRSFGSFLDEADSIVAGWLVTQGERLYESVFSHHMPLSYVVAHVVAWLSPLDRVSHFRVPVFLGYVISASTLLLPWRPGADKRSPWVAPALFLGLAALALPPLNGQMLLADTLWGFAFVVFAVLLLLPFALGSPVSRRRAALGGAALALVLAGSLIAVYPFAVSCALLVAATILLPEQRSLARRIAGPFLLALLGTTLGILLWVTAFGDLTGFFEQAILFNVHIYGPIYNADIASVRGQLIFAIWSWAIHLLSFLPGPVPFFDLQNALTHLAVLAGLYVFALSVAQSRRGTPSIRRSLYFLSVLPFLLVALFMSLRMRGPGFHGVPGHLLTLALLSGAIGHAADSRRTGLATAGALTLVLSLGLLVRQDPTFHANPPDQDAVASVVPAATHVARETAEHERVVSLNASPYFYLATRRRPAVSSIFYLPWQATWEDPSFSRPATCDELVKRQPRFIYVSTSVGGPYPWDGFGACLDRAIKREYVQIDPERFDGALWERRPLRPLAFSASRHHEAGRFSLMVDQPTGSRPVASSRVRRFETPLVRVTGAAWEENATTPTDESFRRLFVVVARDGFESVIPTAKTRVSPETTGKSAWTGYSATLYPREYRHGTYSLFVRIVREGTHDVWESAPLASLELE